MRADLLLEGAVTRIEGPLLFLRRDARRRPERRGRGAWPATAARASAASPRSTRRSWPSRCSSRPSGLGAGGHASCASSASRCCSASARACSAACSTASGRPIDGGPPVAGARAHAASRACRSIRSRARCRATSSRPASSTHRPDEQPGARPEAAAVLRRRPAARPARGRDRAAARGCAATKARGASRSSSPASACRTTAPNTSARAWSRAARSSTRRCSSTSPTSSCTQRLLTPRFALTAAEYLAFVEGKHVLVDPDRHDQLLRGAARGLGEPRRDPEPQGLSRATCTRTWPALYERAGCIRGRPGTLTQLSILTMPADDIGHPIPDLTGYITEGQIVLDRELDRRGIYPPVNVLPSLSRLMKDGTGEGYTHPDHPALAHQLFAAYARAVQRARAGERDGRGGPARDRPPLPRVRRALRATACVQPGRRRARSRRAWTSAGGCCAACRAPSSRACRTTQIARHLEASRRCLTWRRGHRRHASRSSNCRTSGGWCRRATSCSTRSACCSRPRSCASSRHYLALQDDLSQHEQQARTALEAAVDAYGFDDLTVEPKLSLDEALAAAGRPGVPRDSPGRGRARRGRRRRPAAVAAAVAGSPRLRRAFRRLIAGHVAMSACAGNLRRLAREYTRTERRATGTRERGAARDRRFAAVRRGTARRRRPGGGRPRAQRGGSLGKGHSPGPGPFSGVQQ